MPSSNLPSGGFGVTQGDQDPSGPAILPTPDPSQVQQPNVNISGGGGSKGDSGMGGIFGGIGKVVGGLLGGLFAEGGLVQKEYAEGGLNSDGTYGTDQTIEPGPANPQGQSQGPQATNDALAMGYLLGAYHQQNYGGTPETLVEAANKFKQMFSGSNFANGGIATGEDTTLAQQSLMQALGLDSMSRAANSASQPAQSDQAGILHSQQPGPLQASGMPTQMPTTNGSQGFANALPISHTANNPITAGKGYAAGGPPMGQPPAGPPMQNQPPLQPGQMFQGDGSVKGPGGPQDDAIPAKLSNGEFVMSAAATQFFGVDKLNQMNEKGKQGFMQALNQVDQNQKAGPPGAAPPSASPSAAMPMSPPSGGPPGMPPAAKDGGPMMKKSKGYMGL